MTFSAAFPNSVPRVPAISRLARYASGNAAIATRQISSICCNRTAYFSIPTASRIPISRLRLRIDMERIRMISTMLTTVIITISVVTKVLVSERELEIRSYTSLFTVM